MTIKTTWITTTIPAIPIVTDTETSRIFDDIIDYAIHLQERDFLSYVYVRNEICHLILFYKHLKRLNISVRDVTNETLKKFRDDDLDRLKAKSLVSEKKLKRVVNSHLSRVYNFYHWYQGQHNSLNLIGSSDCAITSDPSKKQRRTNSTYDHTRAYPLNFRRIGRSSKHATEHSATEKEVAYIESYFRKAEDKFIAERNSLIMAIANTVGFRRASINSLRCDQFSEEILKHAFDEYIIIKPDEQKFDANVNYKFPILLAYRISDFIKNIRDKWLLEKGINRAVTLDRLFLSSRNGHPLNHTSISDIFGEAFKSMSSSSPRTSIHSLRRKFANDAIAKNFEQRVELKLDVSDASICAAVSMELGQSNPDSIHAYISRIQQQMVNKLHENKNEVIKTLFEENIRLKEEIDRIKKGIT